MNTAFQPIIIKVFSSNFLTQKKIQKKFPQQKLRESVFKNYNFYNCGPAAIKLLASSLSQYCSKFLIYLAAKSLALTSQSEALA